jgi:NAD(P)-dependent dehydrogenase (short-subunit alcohol dehydrogenase family)
MVRAKRIAVVTGAASGIGAATARRLAADGFRVWLADLALDGAEAVAEELRRLGGDTMAVDLDVGAPESVDSTFDLVMRTDRSIDVLVNSAGVVPVCRFEEATQELWELTYRVNVVGSYLCLKAALEGLRLAEHPARVVNVASGAGKMPGPFTAAYSASKAAVISLTRSAAIALAPDILVNSVCPGVIDTPMWKTIDASLAEAGAPASARLHQRVAALPIKRIGTPDEVAATISFLAGADGRYIVGEDMNVNGGYVMH